MNFKRFSKIMAFSLAFPWVACMGGDNNGPDIYTGPTYNHNVAGRIPRYGVGSYSDSGMETDSGTHIFFTSELVYEEPVAGSLPSHCRALNVYFWQESGVLWLSVPRSGLSIAPSQNGDLALWSGASIDGGPWNGLSTASEYIAPPFNPDSTYATLQYTFADVQQTGREDRKATYRTTGGQTFYFGSIAFYYKAGAGSARMYFSAPDIYYEIYTSAGGMAIKTSVPARQVNW